MKTNQLTQDAIKVAVFGLLTVFFGHLQFEIPGSNGVTSNFAEVMLMVCIPFMRKWYFAVLTALFTVFNVAPEGNLISETGNHLIAVLFVWFYYNKGSERIRGTLAYSAAWVAVIGLYYFALLIPIISLFPLITGQGTADEALRTYIVISRVVIYEFIVTTLISLFYVLMIRELESRKKAQQEIQRINIGLENTVQTRTRELLESNQALKVANESLTNAIAHLEVAQNHLVEKEKMAALGHLIAGIAHEMNTPLGAIISSNNSLIGLLGKGCVDWLPNARSMSDDSFQKLLNAIKTLPMLLEDINQGMTRTQKKELIGFLAGRGITADRAMIDQIADLGGSLQPEHLVDILSNDDSNTLISTIHTYSEMIKLCRIIGIGGDKTARVIQALTIYAHDIGNDAVSEISVEDDIETLLVLYQNYTKHGIEIVKNYSTKGKIKGHKDKLSQVWINLITNAIQAMNYRGTLTIGIEESQDAVRVSVADTGCGIEESIKTRIFEPFFTTKKPGEGIGLGLDIVRKIIEYHQGAIDFASEPGSTIFIVDLPKEFKGRKS